MVQSIQILTSLSHIATVHWPPISTEYNIEQGIYETLLFSKFHQIKLSVGDFFFYCDTDLMESYHN